MISSILKMVMQFRRDTASNWEINKDTIPAVGEPCFVIDKNILKIGDGVTRFCDLPPINGVEVELNDTVKTLQSDINAIKSDTNDLQDIVSSALSKVEEAVQAIEIVEF